MDLLRITEITNEHLTNHDTDDLHVVDSGDPVLVASNAALPAILEGDIEQTADVTDGEEDVTIPMKRFVSFCSHIDVAQDVIHTLPDQDQHRAGQSCGSSRRWATEGQS